MWQASEHSESENSEWILKRSSEWIHWPLFIGMAVVPILLYFYQWRPVIAVVIIVALFWRLFIATWFASVRLADFGPLFVRLRLLTCPLMALLIWQRGDILEAALAFLWPIVTIVIQILLNDFAILVSLFAGQNFLQAQREAVQSRLEAQLSAKTNIAIS